MIISGACRHCLALSELSDQQLLLLLQRENCLVFLIGLLLDT